MASPLEPLLLLPGLLCDEVTFEGLIEELSDVCECTVATTIQETIGSMAEAALDLIREKKFSLAGHSMGGYVALEIMRRAPERVNRLALLSTQPRVDTIDQEGRRRELVQMALADNFDRIVDDFPKSLFHENRLGDCVLVASFRKMALRMGVKVFLRQEAAIMTRPDSLATLETIECPTLVLCGQQDLITPVENSQLMNNLIPNSTLTIVEGCGHMAPMEVPDAVNAELRSWIQSSVSSG